MARQVASSSLGTPKDTYFFSIAQQHELCLAIASDNSLRVFSPDDLRLVRSFAQCVAGVTSLASDHSVTYVAGRDGAIRAFDVRSDDQSKLVGQYDKGGISAIAVQANLVAAGTESVKEGLGDVDVLVYDVRGSTQPIRIFKESHTDTITNLTWHPSQTDLLMSGSTDGLVSIFDVQQADEDDALKQVLNPKTAVHCSGFLTDDQAFVLSTDEQFFIYGLDKAGAAEEEALPFKEFGDLRPQLDCSYVVNLLSASFLPSPILVHGNLEHRNLALTMLESPGYSIGRTVILSGAHDEEVVRDLKLMNETTALSCGEDGKVKLWTLQSDTTSKSSESMEIDGENSNDKKRSRKDKKAKKDRGHFSPY